MKLLERWQSAREIRLARKVEALKRALAHSEAQAQFDARRFAEEKRRLEAMLRAYSASETDMRVKLNQAQMLLEAEK